MRALGDQNQMHGPVWDALVVGGGVSGLRVAFRLQRAGKKALVLEARDRVGGRLLARPTTGVRGSVDLGATWVWPTEPRVSRLIADLGLSSFPHDERGTTVYETAAGRYDHPALFDGRPPLRIAGGTSTIAEGLLKLLSPGTVRLETGVKAVVQEASEEGSRRLRVETETGDEFLADHVVLALPPALAVSHIRFEPPLPAELARLAAATPVWMGNVIKTVVVYARRFWSDGGYSGAAISQLGPLQEIHDLSGPSGEPAALFGFSAGQRGADAPSERAVLQQLERLFGPSAADPLEFISKDWRGEARTSPPGVEDLADYDLFGHRAYGQPAYDGTLHWSSCETSSANGSMGHIEDALSAADRAAATIVRGHT
jgi:monoamine oxidase